MSLDRSLKNKKKGAAALVTLMIITFSLLTAGVTLILNTIDLNTATKNSRIVTILQAEANSCIEEAMLRIKRNPGFNGSIGLTLQNSDCIVNISNHGTLPSHKVLEVTSTDGEYNYSVTRNVNYGTDPMQLVK